MKWYKGKRILITGGAGFIGSALAKRLSTLGAKVFVTSRKKNPWRLDGESRMHILVGDLSSPLFVKRAMRKAAPEIVFHVASNLDTRQDNTRMDHLLEGTFGITKNVSLAASTLGVKKFVHIGTIEEYIGGEAPYKESVREVPISPYSLGKVFSAYFLQYLGRTTPMKVSIVRPAATFGPAQEFRMLIPNLIKAAIDDTEFKMNAGMQERDFLFIDDLVDGLLLAPKKQHSSGEIINLGSGKKVPVRKIVETIQTITKGKPLVHFGVIPYRKHDTMLTLLDSSKAKKLLGWKPKWPLKQGLEATVAWYRKHYKATDSHHEKTGRKK